MNSVATAGMISALAVVAGALGLNLQRLLPPQHTSERSRDMISAINSMVTLLLALVLGTLVSSSYGIFTAQRNALTTIGAYALQLDNALAEYGTEAAPGRAALKLDVERGYKQYLNAEHVEVDALDVSKAVPALRKLTAFLDTLDPQTPSQKQLWATANAATNAIVLQRLEISLDVASGVAPQLLYILAAWTTVLFCGYGLLSRLNAMTMAAMVFGAFAIGSAVFLIIELREPYSGLIRVPPEAMLEVLGALGK
jgi:Protein of unknown function (DUF4239)